MNLFDFLETLLIVGIFTFLFVIAYQQIIKPLQKIQFYKNQGIPSQYVPFTGSSIKDSINVIQKGDFYFDWLEKANKQIKQKKPKMLCKNVGSVCSLILLNPKLTQQLFINKDDFIKHQFQNGLIKRLSPNGLVLIQGKLWKKHRKIISKGFQYQAIDSLLGKIHQISNKFISKIQAQKSYNVPNAFNFFKQCAGNIISQVYFQQDIVQIKIEGKSLPLYLSDLIADLANQSYNWKYCIFGSIFVDLHIFQSHRNLLDRIKKIRSAIRSILEKHKKIRENGQVKQFSMWNFFLSKQRQEYIFTDDQIIDQFITFFSDGVYTTGHFMMMLTYNLAKNPIWKEKLTQQFQRNLRNVENPTQALINSLPIYDACKKQTLRLVPPVVTGIERIATKDTCFSDGTKVQKGTMLFACHLVNHLDPNLHDDPTTFNPQRWMDPQSKTMQSTKMYPGSFIPFSVGERHCPGQKFAIAESAIFLSKFLTKYSYKIKHEQHYKLKFTQRFLRQPLEPFGYELKIKE